MSLKIKGTLLESQDPFFQREYSQLEDGHVWFCSRRLFDFESRVVVREGKKDWFIGVGRRIGLSKLEEGLVCESWRNGKLKRKVNALTRGGGRLSVGGAGG